MKLRTIEKISFIVIGGAFLLLCFACGLFVYQDLILENNLDQEIEKIQKTLNQESIDQKELNVLLTSENIKGKYQGVEVAYKKYIQDIMVIINNISQFNNNTDISYIFSNEHIKEDKPDFLDTKEKIESYKKQFEELQKEISNMKKDKIIFSYLPENNKGTYYKNHLKEKTKNIFRLKYLKGILADFSKKQNVIEQANQLLSFLEENQENWSIKEDKIKFKTTELEEKYRSLYQKWEELIG